jgi:hypothetical protein
VRHVLVAFQPFGVGFAGQEVLIAVLTASSVGWLLMNFSVYSGDSPISLITSLTLASLRQSRAPYQIKPSGSGSRSRTR